MMTTAREAAPRGAVVPESQAAAEEGTSQLPKRGMRRKGAHCCVRTVDDDEGDESACAGTDAMLGGGARAPAHRAEPDGPDEAPLQDHAEASRAPPADAAENQLPPRWFQR